MPVDLLPDGPDPATDAPSVFSQKAAAMVLAQKAMIPQFNAGISTLNASVSSASNNASAAELKAAAALASANAASTSASNALARATNAADSATAAAASAASAATIATSLTATSTSGVQIGVGVKTFNTQGGKQFVVGVPVIAVNPASPANFMVGVVSAYTGTSLSINVASTGGAGTLANWNISVTGAEGPTGSLVGGDLTGALNDNLGATIASASTIDLTAATGGFVHISGTATISAVTLKAGAERAVVFDAAGGTLVHGTALLLPGGANISVQANDRAIFRGDTGRVILAQYERANGKSVLESCELLGQAVVSAPVANIDFLSVFKSDFDRYAIEVGGVLYPAANYLQIQLAVAGAVDSSDSYSAQSNAVGALTFYGTQVKTGSYASYTVDIRNAKSGSPTSIAVRGYNRLQSNSAVVVANVEAEYTGTSAVSGFRLLWSAGANFTAGTVRVYGFRNI